MIKHSKSGFPIAKLSKSNEATTEIESKLAELWSVIKQVWYIPFIWSLAWFSYWIFQENIILQNPITQGSRLNYIGFAISVMAIFVKGWISRKPNRKNIQKTGKNEINKDDIISYETLSKMSSQDSQYRESEQTKIQPQYHSLIEKNQIQQVVEKSEESLGNTILTESTSTQSFNLSESAHKEIPSDCLLCPNLANCDQRQKRSGEPHKPCPFVELNGIYLFYSSASGRT